MLILGIESSAAAASAALCRDDRLLGLSYQRSGLTHSRTLLPMIRSLLENTQTDLAAVDAVAVAHGPAPLPVSASASPRRKACAGAPVSPLRACPPWRLWPGWPWRLRRRPWSAGDGRRREQVYNAFFEIRDGRPRRLCPDRAIPAGDMAAQAAAMGPARVGAG